MSDFDQAIQEHIYLYKEGIQDKYYQGAKWAWQHQQAIIDNLKAQLNNIEACYIEKKKQVEDQRKRIDKALSITGNYCDEDDAALLIYVLEKALRGDSDQHLTR
ncbi:hypothetical protein [Acinetobacter sp.]|uniref:hypothetical protein n=1 Tax=Acinetobacter sp. TaxID=472 RepID=UPI0028AA8C43|nr:hypothetical protein [Acinetobacter sp.]